MVVVNLHLTNGYDQWRNKVFRNCRRGYSDIDTLRTVEETDTIVAVNFFLERGLTNNNNFSSLSPSLVCLSYTTYAYHPNTLTCRTSLSSRYLEADENNTQFRRPPNMRQPRIPLAEFLARLPPIPALRLLPRRPQQDQHVDVSPYTLA